MAQRIALADAESHTYGVGGDTADNALPSFGKHQVTVITGSLTIGYKDQLQTIADTYSTIEAGKTNATQNTYTLSGVGSFEFTASGATTFVIRSFN